MNTNQIYGFLKTYIIPAFFLILNGCAVLTIDVDVYKGPLVNDADILAQQTAVMAIGAKPLLIQLRNKLEENGFHNSNRHDSINNSNIHCKLSEWDIYQRIPEFRTDYIPNHYSFCSGQAAQINSILDLYSNNSHSLKKGRLDAGLDELIEEFQNTTKRPTSKEETERARHLLSDALSRFAQKVLFFCNNAALVGSDKDISSYVQVLQAMGNSIIVQADKLNKRRVYDQVLKDRDVGEKVVVKRLTPNTSFNIGREPNSKKVLDQLIASMKYEYLNEVRKNGKDTVAAKNIKTALGLVCEQRSAMVRLRPASAYLQTSFPSTSSEQTSSTGWENLLTKFGFRSISLLGEAENPKNEHAQKKIDKQFWQSVNRIRLSAAGDTNYILMKDDIGNWTVKTMSADLSQIIESAKNLALFGVDGSLRGNMTDAIRDSRDSGIELTKPEPLVKRQFNKFENRYKEQAQKDLIALQKEIAGQDGIDSLESFIKNDWKKTFANDEKKTEIIDALGGELQTAANDKDFNEKTKKAPITPNDKNKLDPAADFIARLEAVDSFYKRAKKNIHDSEEESLKEKKAAAIASMSQTIHDFITKHNIKRMGHVNQFNTKVTVLIESIASEEEPKK